jgi:toxin ParE1/3/4
MKIIWSPRAQLDVDEIYVRIGLRNVAAAERFMADMDRKIELLKRHPLVGVRRPDLQPDIRMLSSPPHLIFYVLEPEPPAANSAVKLLRILDGRRDLKELL